MTGERDEVQIQLAEMKARDDELFTLTTAVLLLWSREDEERENENEKLRKQNDRERQLLRERLQSMVEERESSNKERHEVLSSMDAQNQKKREKQNKKMRMLVEKEIRRKEKKEKEEGQLALPQVSSMEEANSLADMIRNAMTKREQYLKQSDSEEETPEWDLMASTRGY